MNTPLVSIVIPNWNGGYLLKSSLDSLRRQTYQRIEIWVADGNSTDGSNELVANINEQDSRVKLLPLNGNYGFVGNSNEGLKRAQGELIGLFNNDAEAEETWVEEIVKASGETQDPVGIFASKILQLTYGKQEPRIESTGDYLQTCGFADSRGIREPDIGQYNNQEQVFSASGAAVIYRKELLQEIGLLEEAYTSYLEDIEFGLRAHLFGWKCLYVPKAQAHHRWSQTSRPEKASYYVARNTILTIFLGFPDSILRRYWSRILIAQLRVTRRAYRLRDEIGNAERIRGVWDALKMLPQLRKRRKEILSKAYSGADEEIDYWLRWGDEQMTRRLKFNHRSLLPLYVP